MFLADIAIFLSPVFWGSSGEITAEFLLNDWRRRFFQENDEGNAPVFGRNGI